MLQPDHSKTLWMAMAIGHLIGWSKPVMKIRDCSLRLVAFGYCLTARSCNVGKG